MITVEKFVKLAQHDGPGRFERLLKAVEGFPHLLGAVGGPHDRLPTAIGTFLIQPLLKLIPRIKKSPQTYILTSFF